MREAKAAMRVIKAEAAEEVKALKEQLKLAQKREAELAKLMAKKIETMVKAGEKWEKKALAQLEKKLAPKKRRGRPRKKA
ncbi:MAG: hypothetical protein D6717_05375 [Gammaproteobacteria bacterium]|nr:MAG: hypothetical protein D6717_05375 [Gammaproteobacteria bacterium]